MMSPDVMDIVLIKYIINAYFLSIAKRSWQENTVHRLYLNNEATPKLTVILT